jgi:peptide deformylase
VKRLPSTSLTIIRYPDPVLQKPAAPVDAFGPDMGKLGGRMLNLMKESKGVGLAAPQVGLSIRVFVCNATGEPADDLICINPRFIELSGADEQDEGCLSIPSATVRMRRAVHARMEAFDPTGVRFERTADGLLARVWQHEVDHLDGRLIIDAMSPTDDIANRRILKQLEQDYAAAQRAKKPRRCGSSF